MDWGLPVIFTKYINIIELLKQRDVDSATQFFDPPTNPPDNAIRFNRTTTKWEEYSGGTWVPIVLSPAGGGTGSDSISGARSALGIGTLATQDNNAVNITGGTINGVLSGIGAGITALNADNLSNGTIPSGRLPSTLPALNGSLLTNLNASNLATGTIPDARFPGTGVLVPTGAIFQFGGVAAPTGYLLCDGALVSRTTYAGLFAVIGVTHGAGNGTTTFALPNLIAHVPIGAGARTGYTTRALGERLGFESHTLLTPELPSHFHTITDPGHRHGIFSHFTGGITQDALQYFIGAPGGAYRYDNDRGTPLSEPTTTGINATNGAGAGTAHNNMQPSVALNFIIKI